MNKVGIWIDVKGYDAESGARGRHVVRIIADTCSQEDFKLNHLPTTTGSVTHEERRGLVTATAAATDHPFFRAVVRPRAGHRRIAYYNHYLGEHRGQPFVVPLAVTSDFVEAEPVFLENLAPGDDPLSRLVPRELLWAARPLNAVFTYGSSCDLAPFAFRSSPGPAGSVGLMNLIGRLGRGALWLDSQGEAIQHNPVAEAMLREQDGLALRHRRLRTTDPQYQEQLDLVLAVALGHSPKLASPGVIAIPRRPGRKPLLLQAISLGLDNHKALDLRAAACQQALVLVTDPEQYQRGNVSLTLQLFGLTPAEARVAGLVGLGLSPAAVARRLNLSPGTVRVNLAKAYSKLDISRQSELALLVARVEAVA